MTEGESLSIVVNCNSKVKTPLSLIAHKAKGHTNRRTSSLDFLTIVTLIVTFGHTALKTRHCEQLCLGGCRRSSVNDAWDIFNISNIPLLGGGEFLVAKLVNY